MEKEKVWFLLQSLITLWYSAFLARKPLSNPASLNHHFHTYPDTELISVFVPPILYPKNADKTLRQCLCSLSQCWSKSKVGRDVLDQNTTVKLNIPIQPSKQPLKICEIDGQLIENVKESLTYIVPTILCASERAMCGRRHLAPPLAIRVLHHAIWVLLCSRQSSAPY